MANSAQGISTDELRAAFQIRVLFGHQSVGYNIIEGLETIAAKHPAVGIRIVALREPADLDRPGLVHFEAGHNTEPQSKVDDFERHLGSGAGARADLAMLKFCYVDVADTTDIPGLFKSYKDMVARTKSKYPKLVVAHVTMPLVARQAGFGIWLKNLVKRALGRPVRLVEWNIKRNQFNQMLRDEYGQIDPIFDLATIESTLENGERVAETSNGQKFFSLSPDYTDDGGHLNEIGRTRVSTAFVRFLADQAARLRTMAEQR